MKRIDDFGSEGGRYRTLANRLRNVVNGYVDRGVLYAPMMSDKQLSNALERSIGAQETMQVVSLMASKASDLAKYMRARNPYGEALRFVMMGVEVAANMAGHHFSRQEQRYLMEIARRQVERELELKAPKG